MKRFLVFQFDQFYPAGGMKDFTGSHDTLMEAVRSLDLKGHDYFNILDTATGKTWYKIEDFVEE